MNPEPTGQQSPLPATEVASFAEPSAKTSRFDPLEAFQLLRSAGPEMLPQLMLHWQLALVEWAEEKNRLLGMFVLTLLGAIFLHCVLLLFGAVALAMAWGTVYILPALAAVFAAYLFGMYYAWLRFQKLATQSSQAFAATREEFLADVALCKTRL